MDIRFSRAELIYGEALDIIRTKRVAVFGLGGVGSYVVEALARSGMGALDIIDSDIVDITNINRQLYALTSTVGKNKTEVAKERILDINPGCKVTAHTLFYNAETADSIPMSEYDYVVDAIDSVTSKLLLIERARAAGVKIICSMGTGNKTDPSRLEIADISETSVCPLARVMRYELRKRGIRKGLTVCYSKEEPVKRPAPESGESKRPVPGSTAFVPPSAGMLIASRVVNELVFG